MAALDGLGFHQRHLAQWDNQAADRKERDMTLATTEDRSGSVYGYSIWQIGLHWLIAALVFAQLVFGESMTEFVEGAGEGEPASALDTTLANTHYFGIAILALVAVRLGLRLRNGAPPPPESSGAIELAGRISHWLFYVLLVVVPITGLLSYYLGEPFGEVHTLAKPLFIVLIALHVTASLYHQFWRQDGLLMHMVKPE